MALPTTIEEFITLWKQKLSVLTHDNNDQIASDIVGSLAANDSLWNEWYESGREENIEKVINNTADLELPDGIKIKDVVEREQRWNIVKTCVNELEDKYLDQNKL